MHDSLTESAAGAGICKFKSYMPRGMTWPPPKWLPFSTPHPSPHSNNTSFYLVLRAYPFMRSWTLGICTPASPWMQSQRRALALLRLQRLTLYHSPVRAFTRSPSGTTTNRAAAVRNSSGEAPLPRPELDRPSARHKAGGYSAALRQVPASFLAHRNIARQGSRRVGVAQAVCM